MNSFSTSSSRRLPWAGLLAVLLLLAADRAALGPHGIWGRLAIDNPNSAARSHLELKQLRAAAFMRGGNTDGRYHTPRE